MRIQNNITAMNTHRQYTINNDNVAKAAEKLSSGYRINRAGDDAAGLAISEKMRSQIRGLNMATKNSQDAISLVQTAEGALQETQNMLQRMNELAVQAATGTNETLDRNALAKEFEQLKREINDIAEQTTFNNMKILDGSMSYSGYVRSAATAGVTTSTETSTSGAGTIPMVGLGQVNGADFKAPTEEKGASVTVKADGMDALAEAGKTYSINVKVGNENVTFSAKATDEQIAAKTTIGDLFNDAEATAATSVAAQAEGTDAPQAATYTATYANGNLTFDRSESADKSNLFTVNQGEVEVKFSTALKTSPIVKDNIKVNAGKIDKDAGWDLSDDKLKEMSKVGETYTLTLKDSKTGGANTFQVSVQGNGRDSIGKLLEGAISGKTLSLDGTNNETDIAGTWFEPGNGEDGSLRIGSHGTTNITDTSDVADIKGLTAELTTEINITSLDDAAALGVSAGAAATPGPGKTAEIKIDLSEDIAGKVGKDKTYQLTFQVTAGSEEPETVTITSDKAKGTEASIGALFSEKTFEINGKTFTVTDLAEDNTQGIIRIVGPANTEVQIGSTAIDGIKPGSIKLSEVVTDRSGELDADAALSQGGAANITVTTTPSPAGGTDEIGQLVGTDVDFADASDSAQEYVLTLSDGTNSVQISVAGNSAQDVVGKRFADEYGSGTNGVMIGDQKYEVSYNTNVLTFTAVGGDAEDANGKPANLKIPLDGTKISGTLALANPAKNLAVTKAESETIESTGQDQVLKHQDYTLDESKLKVGDSITIGGKTYTVADKTADTADEKGNWTIAKEGFLETVASKVSEDAKGNGLEMIVKYAESNAPAAQAEDGEEAEAPKAIGFTLSETTKPNGDSVIRSDADVTATYKTNSNLTKTTVEFDFAKLQDGDKINIKIDGLGDLQVEKQSGDARTSFMDRIKTQLEGMGVNLDDKNGHIKVNGSALIVEGSTVTVESELVKNGLEGKDTNAVRIQVGALENEQLSVSIDAMNTAGLGLDDAHLMADVKDNPNGALTLDQDAAGRAITAVRDAINKVSDQRATLGAMQNRLDHKIANLKVSSENLSAAESRIRDVDMAQEMTNFTKNNILSQASTAMLAQANALPQNVLSLLG